MDYKALGSVFGHGFFYVDQSQTRLLQWDWNMKTYRDISNIESKDPIPPGCHRFSSYCPRPVDDFVKSVKVFFPSSPFEVKLCHIYLDYDVHLVKALVSNTILTLGELGLEITKDKAKANADRRASLLEAYHTFDSEYIIPCFYRY